MKQYYYPTRSEAAFYNLYKIFPDDMFIYLLRQGFSRNTFQGIQSEMDRIFDSQRRGFEAVRKDAEVPQFPT